MAKCPFCESDLSDSAKKCRHCGEWVRAVCSVCGVEVRGRWAAVGLCAEHEVRSPAPVVVAGGEGSGGNVVAALASCFIPGLGQLSQGRLGAAIGQFIVAIMLWPILLGWLIHIWSAVDAARFQKGMIRSEKSFKMTPWD